MKKLLSILLASVMALTVAVPAFARETMGEFTYEEANHQVALIQDEINRVYNQKFDINLRTDLGRNFTAADIEEVKQELLAIAKENQKAEQEVKKIKDWKSIDELNQAPQPYGLYDLIWRDSKTNRYDKGGVFVYYLKCDAVMIVNQEINNDPARYISEVRSAEIKGVSPDKWTADRNNPKLKVSFGSGQKSVDIYQQGVIDHASKLWSGSLPLTAHFKWYISEV